MTDWIAADWPAPPGIVAGTTLARAEPAALPLPGKPCWLTQVHGDRVVVAADFEQAPDADASVSFTPDRVCVVRTADCLPVLLCTTDGSAIGAAHAGWRGLAAGVIENTVAKLGAAEGEVLAWLGPAISQPSFEVGPEVRDAFIAHDAAAADCFIENDRGRWQADLYALARQRLAAVGVHEVFGGGFCTYLEAERFFSYRRDPNCGRLLSFVGVNSP